MIRFDEAPRRLRWLRPVALGVVGVTVVVAWLILNPLSLLEGPAPEVSEPRDTTELRTATLSTGFDADGFVGYPGRWVYTSPRNGTFTSLPDAGTIIGQGDELLRVDDIPTVVFLGEVPAYRTMRVDDVGDDVLQLEEALSTLGYDPSGLLAIDGVYSSYTATLVEAWQTDLGVDVTGTVAHGDIVFVPPGTRIASVLATAGDSVSPTGAIELSSGAQLVEFEIGVETLDSIDVGDIVSVELPDRSLLEAEVVNQGVVGGGVWRIGATPLDPTMLPSGSSDVPVSVSWTVSSESESTVVRASAIRRLDTAGYVVEVVTGPGDETEFVAVEIGDQSGSTVELLTDLPIGTVVVDP